MFLPEEISVMLEWVNPCFRGLSYLTNHPNRLEKNFLESPSLFFDDDGRCEGTIDGRQFHFYLVHTPVGRKHSLSSMQRQELSNGIWYIEIEAGATPPAWHSTALEGASQGVAQNVITKTQNEIITFNRFFPSHSFKWHYYDIVHVQGQIHFIVSSSKNTRTRVDKSD